MIVGLSSTFWVDFIRYSSVFSALIPLLFFIRRAINLPLKWVLALVAFSFSTDILMGSVLSGVNNVKIFHLYGLIEALIVVMFYYLILGERAWIKYMFLGFFICYAVDAIFIEPDQFNAIGSSIEALMIIFLCLRVFYQFFNQEEETFLDRSPIFWINIAFLVYFSGALFSFILSSDILSQSRGRFYSSWVLNNVSNVMKNILLAVGLWRVKWK